MSALKIIKSNTPTPSTTDSTRSHPVTMTSDLRTTAAELIAVVASAAGVSLDRTTAPRRLNSGERRSQWVRFRNDRSMKGVAATRRPPAKPRPVSPAGEAAAEAAAAGSGADPPPPVAKQSSGLSKVELTIDSLRTYELVRPIPVVVESLADRHCVAEVPGLNITTSASSMSEILVLLKESITRTYDDLRIQRNLDREQARQLKTLESYIGKSKRGWLDRR
jgi:hypothetical protein